MRTSETIGKLVEALSAAQGKFQNPERNRTVKVTTKAKEGRPPGSYTFDYATFDAILAVTRPLLAEHGLAVIQGVSTKENVVTVTTRLAHSSGEWVEDEIAGTADSHDLQAIGSCCTYLKRYSYTAMLNIAAEEDDDGVAGAGHEAEKSERAPLPNCPKCGTNKSVIVGKPEYGGGYVCYGKKGGCGEKWHVPSEGMPGYTEVSPGIHKPEKPAEMPSIISEEEAKYIADANQSIVAAATLPELVAIGELLRTKPEPIRNALRGIYRSRLAVLESENASSQSQTPAA